MNPGKILLDIPQQYASANDRHRREWFINDLAQHHGWRCGAEIGVRFGRTLFCLLDNNPNLAMWAVDKDITQFHNQDVQNRYGTRLNVLSGMSWDMAAHVPDQSLDFFFIDAGHGYKSVIRDLVAWVPKLRPDGWFIGHDINFPAVNQAVVDHFGRYCVGPDNVWFLPPTNDVSMLIKL
jgi:hypothetical protein